jgi:hypothetical protein
VAINPSIQPSQLDRIIFYSYYKKLISTKLKNIENNYLKESIAVAINPSIQPSQLDRIIFCRYYKKQIRTKLNCFENDYLKESIAVPFRAWNKKNTYWL